MHITLHWTTRVLVPHHIQILYTQKHTYMYTQHKPKHTLPVLAKLKTSKTLFSNNHNSYVKNRPNTTLMYYYITKWNASQCTNTCSLHATITFDQPLFTCFLFPCVYICSDCLKGWVYQEVLVCVCKLFWLQAANCYISYLLNSACLQIKLVHMLASTHVLHACI